MLGLVGVRAFTGVYLVRAEGVGWGWLYEGIKKGKMEDVRMGMEVRGERNREGEEEEKEKVEMENDDDDEVVVVVVVTVWDERVIATVVLNVDRLQRKGMVRAWTTMLKYRGAGVGRGVLEEAVRVAVREYGCRKVEFGKDHASEFFFFFFTLHFSLSLLSLSLSFIPSFFLPLLFWKGPGGGLKKEEKK